MTNLSLQYGHLRVFLGAHQEQAKKEYIQNNSAWTQGLHMNLFSSFL
jgi:hypothetical protein